MNYSVTIFFTSKRATVTLETEQLPTWVLDTWEPLPSRLDIRAVSGSRFTFNMSDISAIAVDTINAKS